MKTAWCYAAVTTILLLIAACSTSSQPAAPVFWWQADPVPPDLMPETMPAPPSTRPMTEDQMRQAIHRYCVAMAQWQPDTRPTMTGDFSAPVNGLAVRIDYAAHGEGQFGVILRVKNVSDRTLKLPMGWLGGEYFLEYFRNPDSATVTGSVDLFTQRGQNGDWQKHGNGNYLWPPRLVLDQPRWPTTRGFPKLSALELPPGKDAIIEVTPEMQDRSLDQAYRIKLSLAAEASADKETWSGQIETPPYLLWQSSQQRQADAGKLSLPDYVPPLRRYQGGPSGPAPSYLGEVPGPWCRLLYSQIGGIAEANAILMQAMELYDRAAVRMELEEQMADDKSESFRLYAAAFAAHYGSEAAARFIARDRRADGWGSPSASAIGPHDPSPLALAILARSYDGHPPDWVADLAAGDYVIENPIRQDPAAVFYLLDRIHSDLAHRASIGDVRWALTDLSRLKYKSAVMGLIECFDTSVVGPFDKDAEFYAAVAASLRRLTGQPIGVDKEMWQQWWQEKGQFQAEFK